MKKNFSQKIIALTQANLSSVGSATEKNILKIYTETSVKLLDADFAFVWHSMNHGSKFELVYKSKSTPYTPMRPREHGTNYLVFESGRPFFVKNVKKNNTIRDDAKLFMRSAAIIPIKFKKTYYGNLVLCYKKSHNFTQEEQELCHFIGLTVARAITTHRLYTKRRSTEQEVRKLLRQKDEFLGIASHELKTPVTTIKGFAQLLQDRVHGQDPVTDHFLTKINLQVDKLTRLIRELLDVARIESGKLNFEKQRINLNTLLYEIVEDMQFTTTKNKLIFTEKGQLSVLADRDRLAQVFMNVMSNAIKYSPPGKDIIVELRPAIPDALVMVQDFGAGLPKEYQEKIFDRFFQNEYAGNNITPGLGLGLYISRNIVERHNGKIWCESEPGQGAKFFIKLPKHDAI